MNRSTFIKSLIGAPLIPLAGMTKEEGGVEATSHILDFEKEVLKAQLNNKFNIHLFDDENLALKLARSFAQDIFTKNKDDWEKGFGKTLRVSEDSLKKSCGIFYPEHNPDGVKMGGFLYLDVNSEKVKCLTFAEEGLSYKEDNNEIEFGSLNILGTVSAKSVKHIKKFVDSGKFKVFFYGNQEKEYGEFLQFGNFLFVDSSS